MSASAVTAQGTVTGNGRSDGRARVHGRRAVQLVRDAEHCVELQLARVVGEIRAAAHVGDRDREAHVRLVQLASKRSRARPRASPSRTSCASSRSRPGSRPSAAARPGRAGCRRGRRGRPVRAVRRRALAVGRHQRTRSGAGALRPGIPAGIRDRRRVHVLRDVGVAGRRAARRSRRNAGAVVGHPREEGEEVAVAAGRADRDEGGRVALALVDVRVDARRVGDQVARWCRRRRACRSRDAPLKFAGSGALALSGAGRDQRRGAALRAGRRPASRPCPADTSPSAVWKKTRAPSAVARWNAEKCGAIARRPARSRSAWWRRPRARRCPWRSRCPGRSAAPGCRRTPASRLRWSRCRKRSARRSRRCAGRDQRRCRRRRARTRRWRRPCRRPTSTSSVCSHTLDPSAEAPSKNAS